MKFRGPKCARLLVLFLVSPPSGDGSVVLPLCDSEAMLASDVLCSNEADGGRQILRMAV